MCNPNIKFNWKFLCIPETGKRGWETEIIKIYLAFMVVSCVNLGGLQARKVKHYFLVCLEDLFQIGLEFNDTLSKFLKTLVKKFFFLSGWINCLIIEALLEKNVKNIRFASLFSALWAGNHPVTLDLDLTSQTHKSQFSNLHWMC